MLEVRNLGVTLGGSEILCGVEFSLREHDVMMVVGPNGSGKTTMVRAIMGTVPHEGEALLDGKPVPSFRAEERARRIGVLTQQNPAQFAYSVRDVVAVGRYAHRGGLLGSLTTQDREAIDSAMERTRVDSLANRDVTTLSGGELQRVCLARALAQDPQVLILDEPTNHLDIEHQIALFDIIEQWAAQPGRAVLSIVHDLNLAYRYGTCALLLREGRVLASGGVEEALSSENLKAAYNVDLVAWMRSLLERWK